LRLAAPPSEGNGSHFADGHLALFREVLLSGEKIGTVYIQDDLSELRQRLIKFGIVAIIVALGSLLVAFVLGSWLQRSISGRIQRLAQVTRAVSIEKNYSIRDVKQGGDEVGQLIDGFNGRLEQIQIRDGVLQDAR